MTPNFDEQNDYFLSEFTANGNSFILPTKRTVFTELWLHQRGSWTHHHCYILTPDILELSHATLHKLQNSAVT